MIIAAGLLSLVLSLDPQTQAQTQADSATVLPTVNVTGQTTSTASTQTAADQRMVCRSEPVLGSNRRHRVCMTAGERRELEIASREFRERLVNSQVVGTGGGNYEGAMRGGGMVTGN